MGAIVETPSYEYSCYLREELIADKRRLIANGDKWEPEVARNIESLPRRRFT